MANRVRVGGSFGVVAALGAVLFTYHKRDAAPMPFAPESFPGVEVTTVGSTSARMTPTTAHMPSMCTNDLAPTWEHCTTSPVPSPSAAEAPAHVSAHAQSSLDLTTCVLALMDLLFPWLEYFLLPSKYYEAVKAAREYLVPLFSVTRILVDHYYIHVKHSQLICFVLEFLALWSCAAVLLRWRGQAWARRDDQQGRIQELERQLAQATANAEAKKLALEDQKGRHAQELDDLNLARQLQRAEWDWKVLGLTDEIKDCAKQLDDLNACHQREREDRDQRELEKDEAHQRELSELRADTEQEVQDLNERLDDLASLNSASNRQHSKKNKTLQGLQDALEQEKSRSESEKATLISDHEREISKLQKKLDEVNESIEEISKDHQEMEEERDQALKDLAKAEQGPKEQLQKVEDAWKEKLHKAEAASKEKLQQVEDAWKEKLNKAEAASKAKLEELEKKSKAKLEEAQQESKMNLEKAEKEAKANLEKVYDDLLSDSAQPTLAISNIHTTVSVAPVDADSHPQIPKPPHVSTTETIATAQNPSQREIARRFHFARTEGKIPAFGTIKFGAGQNKAFDFTKPTSHTFSDETRDWESGHGRLANREEVKGSKPPVKTKRRTERGIFRPTDDTSGRTVNLDKKRAEPAKFSSAGGGFMNDAFQAQIANFLAPKNLAKEDAHTPEDQALEDQALEDQALEDQAPEDQAPEDQAPEDQAPEDQAPKALAPKVCYYEKGKPCQSADCVGDPEKYDENGCWIHQPGNETRRYGGKTDSNENNLRRRAKGKQLCCDCYKKSLEDRSS